MRLRPIIAIVSLLPIVLQAAGPIAPSAAQTPSSSVFVRVYPSDAPGLTPPVPIVIGRMDVANGLPELGGSVDLEITIGADGSVRDALIKTSNGGDRIDALAIRAAFNSRFKPGSLNGTAVAVRVGLGLNMIMH